MGTPVEVIDFDTARMADVLTLDHQEFDSSLKALLTAKRLSQSKTTAVTELALKSMEVRNSLNRFYLAA